MYNRIKSGLRIAVLLKKAMQHKAVFTMQDMEDWSHCSRRTANRYVAEFIELGYMERVTNHEYQVTQKTLDFFGG